MILLFSKPQHHYNSLEENKAETNKQTNSFVSLRGLREKIKREENI